VSNKKIANSGAKKALKAIEGAVASGAVRFYRNALNRAYIFCDHPKYPGLHEELDHPDTRGWLSNFVWATISVLLSHSEIGCIIRVLAGMSMRDQVARITDPALLKLIEKEPVLMVVLEFMHTRAQYEDGMDSLWTTLRKFARRRRLLVRGRKHFPGGANVLSRKLSILKPVFELLGLRVDIRRSNGCIVTLTRSADAPHFGSSAQPSARKSNVRDDLSPEDDRKRRIAELKARKASSGKKDDERSKS
jgi:hypothetical protein